MDQPPEDGLEPRVIASPPPSENTTLVLRRAVSVGQFFSLEHSTTTTARYDPRAGPSILDFALWRGDIVVCQRSLGKYTVLRDPYNLPEALPSVAGLPRDDLWSLGTSYCGTPQ